jgi:hypothetical protein
MARDIKVDIYGDIDLSTGDIEFVDDIEEVAQVLKTKTLTLYDEDRYAPETGIKWFGEKSMYDHAENTTLQELLLRRDFLSIPEVPSVPILTLNGGDHKGDPVQVVFVANTIYGQIEATNK